MSITRVTFLMYIPKETISFIIQVLYNGKKIKVIHKNFVLWKTVSESDIRGFSSDL